MPFQKTKISKKEKVPAIKNKKGKNAPEKVACNRVLTAFALKGELFLLLCHKA